MYHSTVTQLCNCNHCAANLSLCGSRKYPYSPHRRDWNFRGGGGVLKSQQFKAMYEAKLEFPELNAQFRPDRDKSDKSTKFGTQFAYTLPNDIRRGAHVNLVMLPF